MSVKESKLIFCINFELKFYLKLLQGVEYYVKDYSMDDTILSNVPPALPAGNYRMDYTLINAIGNKKLVLAQTYGELKRKAEADILWN